MINYQQGLFLAEIESPDADPTRARNLRGFRRYYASIAGYPGLGDTRILAPETFQRVRDLEILFESRALRADLSITRPRDHDRPAPSQGLTVVPDAGLERQDAKKKVASDEKRNARLISDFEADQLYFDLFVGKKTPRNLCPQDDALVLSSFRENERKPETRRTSTHEALAILLEREIMRRPEITSLEMYDIVMEVPQLIDEAKPAGVNFLFPYLVRAIVRSSIDRSFPKEKLREMKDVDEKLHHVFWSAK